jgi:hypothetical protein
MQFADSDRLTQYGVTGLGMPRARVLVGLEGKRLASDGRVPPRLGTRPMRPSKWFCVSVWDVKTSS